MSIVPYSAPTLASAIIPAISNFLLEPKVVKAIAREAGKFITNNSARDPSGAIMSRATTKMGMGKAGFPLPQKNTKMLSNNSVVDYSGSSSSPVYVRSASAAYPVGYNRGAPGRKRNSRQQRVPRGITSYADKIKTCFRASPAITNTSVNTATYAYSLACNSNNFGTGVGAISAFLTQWTSLAGLYREFRITKITIDWVPRVGSTAAGEVAIAVDRDPRSGLSTQAVVVRRNPFFQTDIKVPACLEWTPVDSKDREWKYTALVGLGGARPEENVSCGVLLISSNNDLASGAVIGDLFINAWAEFAVPA